MLFCQSGWEKTLTKIFNTTIMEELKEKIEKFIVDNKLEFNDWGSASFSSDLNGNCVVLAGFLCYLLVEEEKEHSEGVDIIQSLGLSAEAEIELERVFDFAWYSNYENFWETEEAKEEYIF